MSGAEPVSCETLSLHTCAGTLVMTPALAGYRDQQSPRRAAAPGGWRAADSPRYSGDEECTSARVPGIADQAPRTEVTVRILGFSSSNAGNNRWGMDGVDYDSETCTVKCMLKAIGDTHSSLHLMQEFKLGKYAHLTLPSMETRTRSGSGSHGQGRVSDSRDIRGARG